MTSLSVVEYFGKQRSSSCGYCKGNKTSTSHGLWGHVLTPQDYQDLIDRGWRRSGKYCYKPLMKETCCPQYTIQCLALDFKPTKSHKKTLKKFKNYILSDTGSERKKSYKIPELPPEKRNPLYSSDDDTSEEETNAGGDDFELATAGQAEKKLKYDPSAASPDKPMKRVPKPGLGPDPSKPLPRKTKDLKKEKYAKNAPKKSANNVEVCLEDLAEFFFKGDGKHSFQLRLVRATQADPEFQRTFDESYEVYRKYQVLIHKDDPNKCTPNQFTRFLCSSPILEGEPMEPNEASRFPEKYFPTSYGGYHQQYVLDGKIVCVAVLDILPNCVSSVYLYYDPDYSFLSLGTVSALFEISYVRNLQRCWSPKLALYYMGFYIHSCPKMSYKAQYTPSKLLCPQTFEWVDVKDCLALLDKSEYSRLNTKSEQVDQLDVEAKKQDLGSVSVLFQRRPAQYRHYSHSFRDPAMTEEDQEVAEYYTLVGEKVSQNMLLYRSY